MSKLIGKRCFSCGSGTIRMAATAGRKAKYKASSLEIPADIGIPTCDNCDERFIDKELGEILDDQLETIFHRELRKMADEYLRKIIRSVPQNRIEKVLGLGQGSISHLKRGTFEPSQQTVAVLALISSDPEGRIAELERTFSGDVIEVK